MRHAARQDDGIATVLQDRALPRLESALVPDLVAPRLREILGEHGTLEVRVMKHAPGKRCVLGYEFEDGTRVVAKLYRKDRARRHAGVLAELGEALRGATRAPRVLAYWEDWGLVVQQWVPGSPVPDYAELGEQQALVERLATALAEFHAAPVTTGRHADLAAHVRRTCRPGVAALAAASPETAAALVDLEATMYARECQVASTPGPCHGDFGPRQLFVDGSEVYLVDLDGFCQGDPALDVASFRVGLEAHLDAAGRALAGRFLAVYLEARGLEALPTLAHLEAFCELRRALMLWRKRPPDWESDLRRTVARGRARL